MLKVPLSWSSPLAARRSVSAAVCCVSASLAACAAPEPQDVSAAPQAAAQARTPTPVFHAIAPEQSAPRRVEEGLASWYGPGFHGNATANGEVFDQEALTAAHPSLPLPSLARVTRLDTGRSVLVRVNDRGPYVDGRIIDLSRAAAAELGFLHDGVAAVRVEALGPADAADRAAAPIFFDPSGRRPERP